MSLRKFFIRFDYLWGKSASNIICDLPTVSSSTPTETLQFAYGACAPTIMILKRGKSEITEENHVLLRSLLIL